MMNKKRILLISSVIVVATGILFFVGRSHQRHDNSVLMEMVWWSGGWERGSTINYFVVKNDGTLISYRGLSRSNNDNPRTRNFIRTVYERDEIILNESDFVQISQWVDTIVSRETLEFYALANVYVTFLHNGNVYESGTTWSEPLYNLVGIIVSVK